MKNNKYEIDMCNGSIMDKLISFALPLMLSGILQLMFNAVDIVVVGRFSGSQSLAAVGSTTALINVFTNLFIGISLGTNVLAARFYGAGKTKEMSETVHTSIALALVSGVAMAVIGLIFSRWSLEVMGTPEDVLGLSVIYLRIYFIGIIANLVYNVGAAILRAVGDTQRPLYFLFIAGIINVILNLFFVIVFHMGVEGVAYATIIAQAVSAALTIWVLMRTAGCIRVELRALRMTWSVLRQIVSVGIPAALQMAITAFSNVFVQGYINYFGPDCMSGWTAYTKVDQLVILPVQSIAMAGTTFVGQNLGVGDTARAKKGVRTALYLSFAVTAVLLVPVLLLAPDLTAFFNSKAEVVSYGALLLRLLSPFYFFFCINQIYSAALRGAGNSQVPMWIMLGSFVVFRQIYLYIVANYVSNEIIPIAMSYPAGWFVCSVATLIYYRFCKFDSHRLVEDV